MKQSNQAYAFEQFPEIAPAEIVPFEPPKVIDFLDKAKRKKNVTDKKQSQERIGVLLINLGTPDGTDYRSMRRYLKQFLSDSRVIETSRLIWYPILYGMILTRRPHKSGAKYARIWNKDLNESPLRTTTRNQAEKLQQRFDSRFIDVDWAMRYGTPSIEEVTNKMLARGCKHLLTFPLYPQYCAATTASCHDAFFDALKKQRFMPPLRSVPSYPDDACYIDALARHIKQHLSQTTPPEMIIASYHGLPQSYIERGDPYFQECERTTQALRQKLGMDETRLKMCFQSRFGREEWIKPYTDQTVISLAKQGVKSLAIVNPGFVADCLETIDEMGHEVAELFHAHGGKDFTLIPCLNDSPSGLDVLEHLVRRELAGWHEF